MNEALNNILTRRSIRAFTKEQITEEQLETLLEAGLTAPTGQNRQHTLFTVLQGEKLESIKSVISREGYASFYYDAPTLILVSAPDDFWLSVCDCACAIENMLLAAHAMGLGACWINQVRREKMEPEVRAFFDELGIPANHTAFGSVAVGYSAAGPRDKTIVREGRVIRPR